MSGSYRTSVTLVLKVIIALNVLDICLAIPRKHYGRCNYEKNVLSFCLPPGECSTLTKFGQPESDPSCSNSWNRVLVCCPIKMPSLPTPRKGQGCGLTLAHRILGGEITNIHEFPWMALLLYRQDNGEITAHCGGTLINERYVLTAAHCFHSFFYPLEYVRLGEWNTGTNPDVEIDPYGRRTVAEPHIDVPVQRRISHPKYNPSRGNVYDVGLLELKVSVSFTNFIRPICLPAFKEKTFRYPVNMAMDIAGWGLINNLTSTISELKMKTQMKILDNRQCERTFNLKSELPSWIFCSGRFGTTTCKGDSGGPFMAMQGDNYYLVGVVSQGISGCSKAAPVLGVNICSFIHWIREEIARQLNKNENFISFDHDYPYQK